MNHGRSCYLTWMRGAIWRAATSLPSQPEPAVGRQKYRSRVLLRMPRFASNLARPARKVKHTLARAAPPSVSSHSRVRFRSTQTSAAQKALPVMVRIHLVDEYGAVLPAVTGEIGLHITIDIELARHSPSRNRIFPDGGPDRFAVPCHVARRADIYGQ